MPRRPTASHATWWHWTLAHVYNFHVAKLLTTAVVGIIRIVNDSQCWQALIAANTGHTLAFWCCCIRCTSPWVAVMCHCLTYCLKDFFLRLLDSSYFCQLLSHVLMPKFFACSCTIYLECYWDLNFLYLGGVPGKGESRKEVYWLTSFKLSFHVLTDRKTKQNTLLKS